MHKIRLLVFFTYGISLRLWSDKGLLERELQLYRALAEKGIDVTFLTYGDKNDLSFEERCFPIKILPVYSRLKKPRWKWLALIQSLLIPFYFKQIFKESDILKTNQMLGSWVAVVGKLFYRKKLIIRCGFEMLLNAKREGRSKVLLWLMYCCEFISYNAADRIVLSSKSGLDFVKHSFKFPQKKENAEIIPNYVDVELFRPLETVPAKPHVEREIRKEDEKNIVYVGRLGTEKNLSSVIEALAGTGIGFHIIGDGEQKEELSLLASRLGVVVDFLGVVPNNQLPFILNQYSVFILPSLYENHPKSLLEAMSCGMAVIGTKVSGIQEIIQDKINGFLCKSTPQSIREVILKVFSHLDRLSELRKKARNYVIENCRLEAVVAGEIEIYNQLLKEADKANAR